MKREFGSKRVQYPRPLIGDAPLFFLLFSCSEQLIWSVCCQRKVNFDLCTCPLVMSPPSPPVTTKGPSSNTIQVDGNIYSADVLSKEHPGIVFCLLMICLIV